jgi:hypothetical protein
MKQIRIRDQSGRIIAAGYEWGHPIDFVMSLVVVCLFVACIAIGFGGMSKPPEKAAIAIGVAAGLFGIGIWWFGWKKYSVIFHADGTITTPRGLPDNWFRRKLTEQYMEIQSISTREVERTSAEDEREHEVIIASHEGYITSVACDADKDKIYLINTQLKAAFNAVKVAAMEIHAERMAATERAKKAARLTAASNR